MSTVFNVDTSGNLLTIGTIRHSSLNSAGVVHTSSTGVLSTTLVVAADITNLTITGAKIAAATITNANLANMAAHTFKGNNTASSASPLDLTIAQMKTELGIGASVTIGNTQVGFGNSGGNLIGSSKFTWNDTGQVLQFANGSELNFGNTSSRRKVVYYNTTNNNYQYYGVDVESATLVTRVDAIGSAFSFVAGLTAGTEQEVFRIRGNKEILTMAGGGIIFGNATAGYNGAPLDYYEGTVLTFSFSGPWSSPRSLAVTFLRIGRMVLVTWPDLPPQAVTVASQTITSASAVGSVFVPTRFIASVDTVSPCIVYINSGTDTGHFGDVNGANGRMLYFTGPQNGVFVGTAGVAGGSAVWFV